MLPSEYPELQNYPHLRRLMAGQVDMQVHDIRTMLRLPAGDIGVGMNLSLARALGDLISGVSVAFYNASDEAFTTRGNRGARFREVLLRYAPDLSPTGEIAVAAQLRTRYHGLITGDDLPPLSREDAVDVLWERTRNPLAHALGLSDPTGENVSVNLGKPSVGLTLEQVLELEEAPRRPGFR